MNNLELNDILEYFTFLSITSDGYYCISIDINLFHDIDNDDDDEENSIFNLQPIVFDTYKEYKDYKKDIDEYKSKYRYIQPTQDDIIDIINLLFGSSMIYKFKIIDSLEIIVIFDPVIINQNLNDLMYNNY